MRHTTFRFALAPTAEQARMFVRYSGASRFAYNQCLQLVTDALAARKADPSVTVPWSGFDLIKAINRWKTSESAGRVFVVAPDGITTKQVTGLSWRTQISAQVFEEAAVDLGRGLARYTYAAAAWAERATIETARVPDRQAGGWVTHAPGGDGAGHRFCGGETGPREGGTNPPASAGVKDTREGWRLTTSKRPVDAL
jgi:hypothetical protein